MKFRPIHLHKSKGTMVKRFTILVYAAFLIFFVGCAGLIQRKPLTLDNITIEKIRYRVAQNNLKFKSMKANAEISVESPRVNFRANSNLVLKKPDSLFLKIKAPFGLGFGSVFVNKDYFLIYNSFENRAYTGDSQKLGRSNLLPINLELEKIIEAFSGIQLIDSNDNDSLAIDRNKYVIIESENDQKKKYWIDPKKFVVTEFQLLNDNHEPIILLEYRQFEKKNKVILPKLIQITQPARKTRLTILYTSRKPNCQLNESDFFIKIPDQAEKIEL